MNATLEGQTTAHYLAERLENFPIRLTQLAHGLPVGGELDYLDEGTLAQALRARRPSNRPPRAPADRLNGAPLRAADARRISRACPCFPSSRCRIRASAPVLAGRDGRRRAAQAGRRHVRDDVRRARHRPRRDPGRRAQAAPAGHRPAGARPARKATRKRRRCAARASSSIPKSSTVPMRAKATPKGCLSIPDQYAEVERPDIVRARWLDLDGSASRKANSTGC